MIFVSLTPRLLSPPPPPAGTILFDGRPLADAARMVGFVGQDDNLLPTLTGALRPPVAMPCMSFVKKRFCSLLLAMPSGQDLILLPP